jgi:hypothetical protein
MPRKLRTLLLMLVGGVGLVLVALIALTVSRPPPLPPLPNPNGYDDFVKAGAMLANNPPGSELVDMGEDELRTAFATTNLSRFREALARTRVGLGRVSQVPLDYSATSGTHFSDLPRFKQLAFLFSAEGRLAEMENRSSDAAVSYLDAIRLGHESARGGALIDRLVGLAVERSGLAGLEKLTPKLDAKDGREMALALDTVDRRSESPETVLRQEKEWVRRTYGLRGQIARLLTYRLTKQTEQKLAGRMKAQQSQRRSLAVKLAVRAYELETGHPPERLDQLVPKYLRHVPPDRIGEKLLNQPSSGTN